MPGKMQNISAITLRVSNMEPSVRFYKDVLGMELVYGGPDTQFSSLRTSEAEFPVLNLEKGPGAQPWGRLIFHVADVDRFWTYLREQGFDPERPQDAFWGERYFHMHDPDGHELSFACPLRDLIRSQG